MFKIRVTTENGDSTTESLDAVMRRLDDPANGADVITALVQRRRASDVRLKGGQRVILSLADTPLALLKATSVASPKTHELNVGLMFEIPATVLIKGFDGRHEAADAVREILTGLRPPPAEGFLVQFDGEDVEGFINGLEIAQDGSLRHLTVQDLTIYDVNEHRPQLLLEAGI